MNRIHILSASLCLLLGLSTTLLAQGNDWYVSAANYGRYYYFEETKTDSAATRLQFDVNMGNFYAGGWLEAQHVMNDDGMDDATTRLTQRYFGWETPEFKVHVGNFYQVFDRGLILNSFHDDAVSINKVFDGALLNWRYKYFDFDALTAKDTSSNEADPIIRGVRTKVKPCSIFQLGGGYVSYIEIDNNRTNLNEINARFQYDYVDAYVEYAQRKYTDFTYNEYGDKKNGDGTYANITGFYSNFTAMLEYKNYYDLLYRSSTSYMAMMNIPPAVNHQDRLLYTEASNVFVPIVGEVGYRADLTYSFNDYWGCEIDFSKAKSRTPSTVENIEIFGGIRGNFLGDNQFRCDLDYYGLSWDDAVGTGVETFERNELKPEIDVQFRVDDIRSIELDAYLINYDYIIPQIADTLYYYMTDSTDYTEKYLSISYIQSPNIRLTIGGSLSDIDISDDPDKMAFIEGSYIFGKHELIVFWGDERGGLVCSGGVCTYHPTFQGVRVTLLSRL